jgi:DNA-binding NarL/FixJ family response regulator
VTNILIADDHMIVREGLKQVLVDTPDMVVTDEAKNGEEAYDCA